VCIYKIETDFDEYVDMNFQGNSQAATRPFSSIYTTPWSLKNHKTPSNVGWNNIKALNQLGKIVLVRSFWLKYSRS